MQMRGVRGNVLHAPATARPVAIVKIEAFALEDEGAHAVLGELLARNSAGRDRRFAHT